MAKHIHASLQPWVSWTTTYGIYIFSYIIYSALSNIRELLVLNNVYGTSSLWCFTCFAIVLNYNILSPLMFCFISLSRLKIVINPLDTSLKQPQIVAKIISIFFCFIHCIFH